MSTSVYTSVNPFNFIRKRLLQICVRKVAVHLKKGVGSDVHDRRYRPEPNLRTVAWVHSDFPNALYQGSGQ
jgi:hypothetical protein